MNSIYIRKYLCPEGQALEQEWDRELKSLRVSPDENSLVIRRRVYEATKRYFEHRSRCEFCYIRIGGQS
jgi:hypothetical protein